VARDIPWEVVSAAASIDTCDQRPESDRGGNSPVGKTIVERSYQYALAMINHIKKK